MANKSKAKGTRAETNVVKFLEKRGWRAKRQPLSGNKDIGDIIAYPPSMMLEKRQAEYIIEVKAGKQCSNPSRSQLEEWIRQAEVEAKNAWPCYSDDEHWILVVVRYNRALKDADVYLRNHDGNIEHCWLDQIEELVTAY